MKVHVNSRGGKMCVGVCRWMGEIGDHDVKCSLLKYDSMPQPIDVSTSLFNRLIQDVHHSFFSFSMFSPSFLPSIYLFVCLFVRSCVCLFVSSGCELSILFVSLFLSTGCEVL